MTNNLKQRIIREGIVDTKTYRYIYRDGAIYRLPIKYLDTTAAINGWERI